MALEPVAHACLNAVELSRREAVRLISRAEKALEDGDSKGALRLLSKTLRGDSEPNISDPKLAQRLERLFAVACFRAGSEEGVTKAIIALREQLKGDSQSPWLKTRLAEALSYTAKGTKEALSLLESLAKADR